MVVKNYHHLLVICVSLVATALAAQAQDSSNCKIPPVKLLEHDKTGTGLKIVDGALDFLRDPIHANRPVVPITVVGTARSGKSFFLGMVTGCRNSFPVGHTLQAETEGANMFVYEKNETQLDYYGSSSEDNITTTLSKNKKPLYLLIDTEGLDYSVKEFDRAILLFSTLVSSHMVYHLSETIKNEDMKRLYSVALLVQSLSKVKLDKVLKLPKLALIVERFSLQGKLKQWGEENIFTEEGGKKYLEEEILKEVKNPNNDESISQYNATVKTLRYVFKFESVFFVHPAVKNDDKRTQVDEIPVQEMDAEYRGQLEEIKKVLLSTKPKTLQKNQEYTMTCGAFADYIEEMLPMVNHINNDLILDHYIDASCKQAQQMALEHYIREMNHIHLPLDEAGFEMEEKNAQIKALHVYNEKAIQLKSAESSYVKNKQMLETRILDQVNVYKAKNENKSRELCDEVLATVKKELQKEESQTHDPVKFHKRIEPLVKIDEQKIHGVNTDKCIDRIHQTVGLYEQRIREDKAPLRVTQLLMGLFILFFIGTVILQQPWVKRSFNVFYSCIAIELHIMITGVLFMVTLFMPRAWYAPASMISFIGDVKYSLILFVLEGICSFIGTWLIKTQCPANPELQPIHPPPEDSFCVTLENCPSLEYAKQVSSRMSDFLEQRHIIVVVGVKHKMNLLFRTTTGKLFIVILAQRRFSSEAEIQQIAGEGAEVVQSSNRNVALIQGEVRCVDVQQSVRVFDEAIRSTLGRWANAHDGDQNNRA